MRLCVCSHTCPSSFCRRLLGHRNDYCSHSRCFQKAVLMSRLLGESVLHESRVIQTPVSGRRHRQQRLLVFTCTVQMPFLFLKFTCPGACTAYDSSLFCFCCHVFSTASQLHSQRSQQLQSPGHSQACNPSQPGHLWSML